MNQTIPSPQESNLFNKFNENDKNLFLKMAINDENEANTLMTYYRNRLADFDKERQEWLEKIELSRQSQEEKHKTDWELHKRKDEISELQTTISELKLSLFDERQHILNLKKENDLLKMKELQDRKKIAELLSLTNSVEEEIIMYKDLRPDVNTKNNKNDLNIYRNKENYDKTGNISSYMKQNRGTIGQKGKSVVKTIYLPNEQLNTVAIENESLRTQMEEQNRLFSDQINILKEELNVKLEEAKIRNSYDNTMIKNIEEKLQKKERHLLETTKEYFAYRMKSNENDKRLHEENELLRLRNAAIANKLLIFSKQNEIECKVSKELTEKRTEEYTNKYRNQIRSKEESLQLIKDQYAKIQEIYLERIKELEENLTKLSQKYQKLEHKRNLEVEGLKQEMKRMKSQTLIKTKPELLNYNDPEIDGEELHEKSYKDNNTKLMGKEDTKETKKRDNFKEFQMEEDLENKQIKENVKINDQDEMESQINESVNLEELEHIKKQLDDLESKLDIKKKK